MTRSAHSPSAPDFERAVPRAPSYAAAVLLSEPVTLTRIVGTILLVAGVVLISR